MLKCDVGDRLARVDHRLERIELISRVHRHADRIFGRAGLDGLFVSQAAAGHAIGEQIRGQAAFCGQLLQGLEPAAAGDDLEAVGAVNDD